MADQEQEIELTREDVEMFLDVVEGTYDTAELRDPDEGYRAWPRRY